MLMNKFNSLWTISFPQQTRMCEYHPARTVWNMALKFQMSVSEGAHAQLSKYSASRHNLMYHTEEITRRLRYIYTEIATSLLISRQ